MAASMVVRLLLGLRIRDCTGGFKCFRRSTLESIDFRQIKSKGFASSYEINYACHRSGKKLREVPIKFIDRRAGESKLSWSIFVEAMLAVVRLRISGPPGA